MKSDIARTDPPMLFLDQNTLKISKEKPVRKVWILKMANNLFFFIKKQLMGLLKYLQR